MKGSGGLNCDYVISYYNDTHADKTTLDTV